MAVLKTIGYVPTVWVNNSEPDIDEGNLNKMEKGIADACNTLNELVGQFLTLKESAIPKNKIVNNLLATDPGTVLSGPMGKTLQDQITSVNSDLTIVETNLNNVSTQLDPLKSSYTADINTSIVGKVNIVLWDVNTLYTPFKTGNTVRGNGFCITYNSGAPYLCQVAMAVGDSNLFTRNSGPEGWSGWTTK